MTHPHPGRLTAAALEDLLLKLSDRDRRIILDLARVRVLTGAQLSRLHFADLAPSSSHRIRRRVLTRLSNVGVTTTLDRRIGGVRAGSSGLVWVLDLAGQRLLALLGWAEPGAEAQRARRPWTPGSLFLGHSLDVSELYVQLREAERAGHLALDTFTGEPASWWPTGYGGHLKPDAYAVVRQGSTEDSYWIECDRATESLPTLRRKLLSYVDFALSGQLGPERVVPQVLVTVPHEQRLRACLDVTNDLPEPAHRLIQVVLHRNAVVYVSQKLDG